MEKAAGRGAVRAGVLQELRMLLMNYGRQSEEKIGAVWGWWWGAVRLRVQTCSMERNQR